LPPKSLTEFAELPGRQVSDRGGVRCGWWKATVWWRRRRTCARLNCPLYLAMPS